MQERRFSEWCPEGQSLKEKTSQHQCLMVDVVFLMNSDVKTLNFCSPTIEKVLLQLHHISGEGKRGVGGGGVVVMEGSRC